MTTTSIDKQRVISQIRDLTQRRFGQEDAFLHHLPDILDNLSLPEPAYASFLSFVNLAVSDAPNMYITEALKVLNRMVNRDDGMLATPASYMFADCRYYTWKELGGHADFKSALLHIINKATMFSKIGRSSFGGA